METDFDDRISEFFLEYVHPRRADFTPSGNLTLTAIRASASLLLKEDVFSSQDDMKAQAMKDYHVVLPEAIFE